jgi:Ca2+:H+ antiporter
MSMSSSQQLHSGAPPSRLQRHGSSVNSSSDARGAEIRDSQLYKRILGQSLKQVGLGLGEDGNPSTASPVINGSTIIPHIPPPKSSGGDSVRSELRIPGLSELENTGLVREVAEIAATAATIAARDASSAPRKTSIAANRSAHKPPPIRTATLQTIHDEPPLVEVEAAAGGGHDAPNWSRMKSSVILCGATVLYALIAEILVNTVDVVLKNVAIDEKFLGITLFALVPNTTEFLVSPCRLHIDFKY